jgi:hypothetical protein
MDHVLLIVVVTIAASLGFLAGIADPFIARLVDKNSELMDRLREAEAERDRLAGLLEERINGGGKSDAIKTD